MAPVTRSKKQKFESKNGEYSFDQPRAQNLCLPHDYRKYILNHLTPMVYFNLCKLFFSQKRVLVTEKIECNTIGFIGTLKHEKKVKFSFKTVKASDIKLWIAQELFCYYDEHKASSILDYLYAFDYSELRLEGQNLTNEEYEMLVGSMHLSRVTLKDIKVEYMDNSIVPAYELLQKLAHVKELFL